MIPFVYVVPMPLKLLNTTFCTALNFCLHRNVLFDNLHRNGLTLLPYKSCHLTRILLYGDIDFSIEINRIILSSVIRFLLTSKRFEGSLFS